MLPNQLEEAVKLNVQNSDFIEDKHSYQPVKNVEVPVKRQLGDYYDALKAKFVRLCSKKHA